MLQVVALKTKKTPLMFECGLDKNLDGPYLVSSTKSFVWIHTQFPGNLLRAATRTDTTANIYKDITEWVFKASMEQSWGSCSYYTSDTLYDKLQVMVNYLNYYGFENIVVYSNQVLDCIDHQLVNWLPDGYVMLTPNDNSYVGTLYSFNKVNLGVVVHNPSRGMCVLCPQ